MLLEWLGESLEIRQRFQKWIHVAIHWGIIDTQWYSNIYVYIYIYMYIHIILLQVMLNILKIAYLPALPKLSTSTTTVQLGPCVSYLSTSVAAPAVKRFCLHWALLDLHTGTAQEHQGWAKASCTSAVVFLAIRRWPVPLTLTCWWYWIWFYLGL